MTKISFTENLTGLLVIACIQKDKRCVTVFLSLADCTEIVKINQKEKNGQITGVQCLKAVHYYYKKMGFFDYLKSL